MGKKIGRNEPCPCGSGKKYKKCCGQKEHPDFSLPEDLLTGTPLDDYMHLYQGVAIYAQGIAQFEEEGKALKKVESEYEKKLRPGEEDGIPLSLFMSWLHFDFRFGRTRETVVERFMRSTHASRLIEPGPTHLKHFAQSYCAFYEILEVHDDRLVFSELGTGETWQVYRANEPFEKKAVPGDIWYLRLLGQPSGAYIYTPPFIYPPEAKSWLTMMINKLEEAALDERLEIALSGRDLFREACKANVLNWALFFLGHDEDVVHPGFAPPGSAARAKPPRKLTLVNTDGELLSFSKVFFQVKDRNALTERLSALDGVEYDAKEKDWTWLQPGKRKSKTSGKTVIATLRFRGDRLIAETNSLERAARLIDKLKFELGDLVAYEKTESKSYDSMPKPTEEEMKKYEKEQEELYANPEFRKFMAKQREDYYLKEWVRAKVPALNNQTPLAAVKTEEGRRLVQRLLEEFDEAEKRRSPHEPKFDFDRVRIKLGLPPRAN